MTIMFQIPILPDPTTPQPSEVLLPEFQALEASQLSSLGHQAMFENTNIKTDQTDSPDSGHKEMSSDSLSVSFNQHDTPAWYTPMTRLSAAKTSSSDSKANFTSSGANFSSSVVNNGKPKSDLPSRPGSLRSDVVRPDSLEKPDGLSRLDRMLKIDNNKFAHSQDKVSSLLHSPDNNNIVRQQSVEKGDMNLQLNRVKPFGSNFSQSDTNNNPGDVTTSRRSSDTTIITPMPPQDASGNRLELNVAPKLNPPPKVKRTTNRSPAFADLTSPESNTTNCSSRSSTTSENSLNDNKRSSRDSSKMSEDASSGDSKELNTKTNKDVDINVNNLNHDSTRYISTADSTTKLRLSFSDEENTENSEDSGVPQPPRRLDSMTFDEFDALSS